MKNDHSSNQSAAVAMNTRIQSPSLSFRKSSRGKEQRRETRNCKPHPCMATLPPTTPRRIESERSNASERIRRALDGASPRSGTAFNSVRESQRVMTSDGHYAPSLTSRSYSFSRLRIEGDTPSSHRKMPLDCGPSSLKQIKTTSERQTKPMARRNMGIDATSHPTNQKKALYERSQSERFCSRTSTFHDSDTVTLESNYDGPDGKPFLQLCFDGMEDSETARETDLQRNRLELDESRNRQRGLTSRALSLRNLAGPSSSPTKHQGNVSQSPQSVGSNRSSVDRRTQLQKSKSISLRAVECTSVRDMTNIITSATDDQYCSVSNSTMDETEESPSSTSFPYEASINSEESDESESSKCILAGCRTVGAGLFKSLSLNHARSTIGLPSNSPHNNETPRLSLHRRLAQKKLNLKGAGETLSLLSHKLFLHADGGDTSTDHGLLGNRKKIWGSCSERRERSLSSALQMLGGKSSHEQQHGSRRPDLRRMQSSASVTSCANSVISCSTIDRRRLLERSKSTTSVASFSITPSLRGANSEHLRTVNAFVYDSAKPLTQESRESLHALLTDSINLVMQPSEAPAVLEKYRGVSGDDLVELMKSYSQQLNDTMHVC